MKTVVKCQICDSLCNIILQKSLPINKDILAQCPNCECVIAIRLFKSIDEKLWS